VKKIGIFNATRFWQKYVFGNPPDGFFYKRAIDIPMHIIKVKSQFLLNTKWVLPFQGFDLYHTYNSIVPINKPWVAEVESFMPRFGNMKETHFLFKWAIKRLNHKSCKAIIFTSQFSRKMNEPNFVKWGIDSSKCHVIYRAVAIYESLVNEASSDFNILFAGNAFYRKGGTEFLKAIERIDNPNIKITIISSFEIDWEIYPSNDEQEWVKNYIAKDKRITVFTSLPHAKVIIEMQKSHVFVATTFADPFNNTILEAMSCGVPIIASNIRSIPEFVEDNVNGYTITPNKENKEEIIDFIEEKLLFLIQNPNMRQEMSNYSIKIIKENFSIATRNNKLKKLYESFL